MKRREKRPKKRAFFLSALHKISGHPRHSIYWPLVPPTAMNGWFLDGENGEVKLRRDLPIPSAAKGWAVVQVTYAGVCATDLQMINGYKGGFSGCLGHEFVGRIHALQDADQQQSSPLTVGQRVVGEINIPCRKNDCGVCQGPDRIAARSHCPSRACLGIWQHNGAFAQYLTLPLANLFPIDDAVPDKVAVFTEPLAAACRILEQEGRKESCFIYEYVQVFSRRPPGYLNQNPR